MMNIDLIAGYFVGKIDKKFADKENSYRDDILIPVRFISPYEHYMQGNDYVLKVKEKLDVDWPMIEGKIRYLLSLYYNEDYIASRKLKLCTNIHTTSFGKLNYLSIDYEMKTLNPEIVEW